VCSCLANCSLPIYIPTQSSFIPHHFFFSLEQNQTNDTMQGDRDYVFYPYLADQEFVEVCHHFDRRYRQAQLGEARRRWQVDVLSAVDAQVVFAYGPERYTWLQITRPLEKPDDGDLSSCLDGFSFSEPQPSQAMDVEADSEMMTTEEADQVRKQPWRRSDE
jgi:ubiquitin-like-conjugating enzyme ATG10